MAKDEQEATKLLNTARRIALAPTLGLLDVLHVLPLLLCDTVRRKVDLNYAP